VGNTPKNVDENMLAALRKMLTKKCSQYFQKILIEKILTTTQKIISRKNKKTSKARGYWGLE
jgi:hypothetical protein